MSTHDLSLPSSRRVRFPDRCVGCDALSPGNSVSITVTGSAASPGLGEAALDAALGSTSRGSNVRVTREVPACVPCGQELLRRHRWKDIWLYAGALGGTALLFFTLLATNSIWLALIPLGAGILGPVIYELRNPPAFTFTPSGKTITYEFRSKTCADEFAAANPQEPA